MQKNHQYILLTNILTAALLAEGMEELATTPVYRQELKNAAKTLVKHLERYTAEMIPLIWGLDDAAMYKLMDYQKELIHKLALLKPEDMGVVNEIIDKYRQHPAKTLRRLEIKLVDSSKLNEEVN